MLATIERPAGPQKDRDHSPDNEWLLRIARGDDEPKLHDTPVDTEPVGPAEVPARQKEFTPSPRVTTDPEWALLMTKRMIANRHDYEGHEPNVADRDFARLQGEVVLEPDQAPPRKPKSVFDEPETPADYSRPASEQPAIAKTGLMDELTHILADDQTEQASHPHQPVPEIGRFSLKRLIRRSPRYKGSHRGKYTARHA